ncbi:MAG: TIGR04372 family glycosyltransferase, partial [Rhodospirillales bacterium]
MQDIIEQLIATTKGQLARYESIKDNQAALYPLALNISTLGLFPQQYQVMGQYLRLCYQGRDWGRAARLMPFAGGHHFLNFYGETSVVLQVLSLMRTLGFPLPASFVRSEDLSAAAAPLLDVVPGLFGKAVPEAEDFIGDHFLLSDLGLPRDRAALALWQHWEQKGGGLPQPFSLPDRMWGALKAFKKVQGWGERDSFVVIHAREDGYRPEAEKHLHSRRRSVDITTYDKAINRLLAAGIRVVRLGDASMRSLTARDGLVDLCRLPRDTDVELALLAEAR